MNGLMWALHAIASAVLIGIGVTIVLVAGLAGWKPIALAAALGFVLALPVAWLVANRIQSVSR
ncbi:MAG: hypothetical protein KGM18_06770 [Sphingomonadales bacterium]|nr:hypothetical protein [Sphingomonadales bacterium]